jgi:hypothetical protein
MRYISTSLQLTIDQFFSPKKPTDISGLFHNIFIMIKPSTRKKSTTKISKKNEEKQKFDDSISFYVQSSTHFQVLYFLICPFHIFCRTSQFIYMFCSFFFFFLFTFYCALKMMRLTLSTYLYFCVDIQCQYGQGGIEYSKSEG